jgi:DNA-binding CsgD family transcriptional regulator
MRMIAEGYTCAEISQIRGVSRAAVTATVRRIRTIILSDDLRTI